MRPKIRGICLMAILQDTDEAITSYLNGGHIETPLAPLYGTFRAADWRFFDTRTNLWTGELEGAGHQNNGIRRADNHHGRGNREIHFSGYPRFSRFNIRRVSPPRLSFQLTGARPRGSALLIALSAIAMLSVTILGVVEYVQNDCEEVLSMKRDLRALQLANTGVAVSPQSASQARRFFLLAEDGARANRLWSTWGAG